MAAALDELAREVDAGADLVLARPHGLAVLDDRRLRGGAAHVERDQVAASGEPAEVAAGHHAGGGAGLDEVRRLAPRRLGRERAAARLHHLELGADAGLAQAVDERAEVAGDRRPDVGVDDGRARALVLADLGQDLRRARHVDAVADGLTDDLLDAPLVRVVGVRVEQRDRDCLDIVLADLLRDVANGVLVERRPGLAARADPLGDLVPEPAGDERPRALVLDVVEHRNPQPAHLEHVAEALRRHERGPRSEPLEHRVRGDRGGVDDAVDLVARDAAGGEQGDCALDDAAGVVVGRRQHLGGAHGAVVAEQDDVGERAADVDAEAVAQAVLTGRSGRLLRQHLAGVEDPVRVEARLDRLHQRDQVAVLLHEGVDLAEADAVLARAGAAAREGVVDDVVHELLGRLDRAGLHLHGDVEVAVAGVAEDAGIEAEPVDLGAGERARRRRAPSAARTRPSPAPSSRESGAPLRAPHRGGSSTAGRARRGRARGRSRSRPPPRRSPGRARGRR